MKLGELNELVQRAVRDQGSDKELIIVTRSGDEMNSDVELDTAGISFEGNVLVIEVCE